MDRENFWTPSIEDVMSSLKFRVSYGKLGNQSVGVNTFRELIGMGRTSWLINGEQNIYARVPAPLPANIGWEKITSRNLGAGYGLSR